jgi:PhnB protein
MSDDTTTSAPTTGVTGTYTTNGTPTSATAITPFIVVPRAEQALEFYRDVFAARIVDVTRMLGANGQTLVAHAVLDFGHGLLQLGEAIPDYHLVAAPEGDDDCYSLGLYCPDTDAVVAKAVAAGATVREPATTFVSGDRFASIRDPFGVRWSIMTRVEDLSDEESGRRVAEWAAQFSTPSE